MSHVMDRGARVARIVVAVPGPDVDLAAAPGLRATFATLAVEDGATVVVDLSSVTFMDCAGLGSLVSALARFKSRLVLLGVGRQPMRLLELTGLDRRFRLETAGEP